jgi:catechol 2,3-dioxygenase-like lactoylglutathione lyase family enzyme
MTALSTVRHLHHVAVQTAHFDQMVQFYTVVLGAELLVHGALVRPRRRGGRDSRTLERGEAANPKSEFRNPKQARNSKDKRQTYVAASHCGVSSFVHSNLFRISDFVLRIC